MTLQALRNTSEDHDVLSEMSVAFVGLSPLSPH